jgi:hypothetical protein
VSCGGAYNTGWGRDRGTISQAIRAKKVKLLWSIFKLLTYGALRKRDFKILINLLMPI